MIEPTPSHHKVKPLHLRRNAYLYVRQSSMRQVLENTESTKRQYQLRERALALGWQSEQIRVIDCDQGHSGASEAGRDGFQQLVAEVSLGNAGIVMGLEVSRLARNNADWHRLLQLCAFTDSLILDQDGLYDPGSFNDRLLLGLKGAMSEAELHVLRTRLQEGLLNKARRGELKTGLPVGLDYDELGRVILCPDRQVRAAMERFFDSFRRLGAAFSVVREFHREGIQMPHQRRTGPQSGRMVWGDLTYSQTLHILHSPRYAGAYVYGRCRCRRGPDGLVRNERRQQEEWLSLIRDAHAGYISWDEFLRNQQTLLSNAQAYGHEQRRTPPREGPALLQGLVVCGVCGKTMGVRYHQRRGQLFPDYVCQHDKIELGNPRECQHIPGGDIDLAVVRLLATMLNEQNIDIATAVHSELQSRLDKTDRLRLQQVERCRYEADLARRRYQKVDPDKRYVAEVLEAEWNNRLRDLENAQTTYDQARRRDESTLDQDRIKLLGTLAGDFAALWRNEALSDRDRKRIVRLLIKDVTLIRGDSVTVHIRFTGGTCKTLNLPPPRQAWEQRKTAKEVVDAIDQLLNEYPDYRIAAILNDRNMKSGTGQTFSPDLVTRIRMMYQLPTRWTRLRQQGKLTASEVAEILGVSCHRVRYCRAGGLLHTYEYKEEHYLYDAPASDTLILIPELKQHARSTVAHTTKEAQYAT